MTDAKLLTDEELAAIRRTAHTFAFHWLHKERGERVIFDLLAHVDAQAQHIAALAVREAAAVAKVVDAIRRYCRLCDRGNMPRHQPDERVTWTWAHYVDDRWQSYCPASYTWDIHPDPAAVQAALGEADHA